MMCWLLLSLLSGCWLSPKVETGPRPNVLVVMWDTVRADRMSLYGHSRKTTPALERWAEDAQVFEHAVSPAMWTVPAHASLFTGLMPTSHGSTAEWIWLDGYHQTLAEQFGQAGYATWAYSSNPYLSDRTNLLQGFDTIEMSWRGHLSTKTGEHTMGKLDPHDASVEMGPAWDSFYKGRSWPEHLTMHKDGSGVGVEAFTEWLDAREEDAEPFFAYLNFLEAHHPRIPTREARERILTPEEVKAGYATEASLFRTMAAMERINTFLPEELEAMRGVYDAALLELDDATHVLFEALKARGLEEDTLVVLVSDHGEHLGERRMFDHRWSLYEPLVHVPLIIKWPGHVPAGRTTDTVSTLDVFGTLFSLTGVGAPEGVPLGDLMGVAPERVHSELAVPMPRHGAIRKAYPDLPRATWQTRYHAMYEKGWKLLRLSSGKHELYDLNADPTEQRDWRQREFKKVREMNGVAQQWRDGLPAYDLSRRGEDDQPKPALSKTDPERQRLEALGYVEGDP